MGKGRHLVQVRGVSCSYSSVGHEAPQLMEDGSADAPCMAHY
jgi:hypothetical protein